MRSGTHIYFSLIRPISYHEEAKGFYRPVLYTIMASLGFVAGNGEKSTSTGCEDLGSEFEVFDLIQERSSSPQPDVFRSSLLAYPN